MNRRLFLTALSLSPLIANDFIDKSEDIYLSYHEYATLKSLNNRLKRLSRYIGYANFNIVSFNDSLYYGRNYPKIGEFTKDELSLVDKLFSENPNQYGFYGSKTCSDINNIVSDKDIVKISHTGHFLFQGTAVEDYEKLKKDVGQTLVLTSGVRNVVKQLSLYANKLYHNGGNITQATIQIAPPAYSYHTISDFDVGVIGWGYKNFTDAFASTLEFEKMKKLDYISMRYKKNNSDGVRFEPWHVEVI
ncbi:periplasmic D-alanyl-D-alanine carboxypeptidase [Sulfurimonas gotlandica GD1]|jgi:D-alanyl-D-alanine carboxypeptidase|uniref:Periplasmic D-alanyl-D-alanine carboxypeptidase n=1 Tax=Sulfurimonas gotlandica (strain DSM 19862 / JCM 16533 / GD1) TaxID=929558 RepID=B6BLV5_SULGG|nr:M15 family metallopeptidase [Sulfurimonas gotlandica]EDZ61808.1 twin-arginine translocation pathway signal sequence domain protein [Sulfurimonas gotlandica GD1]EHP29473.1 periplasmic D-alanyl-D-alanine carboxypeptidase [Sulfurimonas gotlandica GD1]